MTRPYDTGVRAVPYRYTDAFGDVHHVRLPAPAMRRDLKVTRLQDALAGLGCGSLADAPDGTLDTAAAAAGVTAAAARTYRAMARAREEEAR